MTDHTADWPHVRQLKQSLIETGVAKPAGETFGDFIQACRELGFKDTTRLAFIEYGIRQGGLRYLVKEDDDDPHGIGVREL